MSINGVRHLRSVTIGYCDYTGASRGVREFIRNNLIDFAKKYPQVKFHARLNRRHDPVLAGSWLNNYSQRMTLSNLSPAEVQERVERYLNKTGRNSMLLWPKPRSSRPSLQGQWSPLLNYTKPAERIYPPDYIPSLVKKMPEPSDAEVLALEQKLIDEGRRPETVKKLFMTDQQKHRSKIERVFFSGLDNVIKLKENYGLNVIPPVEIRDDPEKLAAFHEETTQKLRELKAKEKEDKRNAKVEKREIKNQLRREKMYQSWRDNIIIKAKYPFASVRPAIVYGEWPPKNADGTIHRGPLDFALRPNEEFLKHFPHRASDAIIDAATGKPLEVAENTLKRAPQAATQPPKRTVPVYTPQLSKEQTDTKIPYFVKKQWLNDHAKAIAEKREAIYEEQAKAASQKANQQLSKKHTDKGNVKSNDKQKKKNTNDSQKDKAATVEQQPTEKN